MPAPDTAAIWTSCGKCGGTGRVALSCDIHGLDLPCPVCAHPECESVSDSSGERKLQSAPAESPNSPRAESGTSAGPKYGWEEDGHPKCDTCGKSYWTYTVPDKLWVLAKVDGYLCAMCFGRALFPALESQASELVRLRGLETKLEKLQSLDFAETLAHHAWDAIERDSRTFAGVTSDEYSMNYAQAGGEIQAEIRAILSEGS